MVHSWWERYKTTNAIVIFLLVTTAIIGLGNLVTAVEAVATFVSMRIGSLSGETTAQKAQTQTLTQPSDQKSPPVEVLLADGEIIRISWDVEFEVMPQDAPMYAVEFDGMADVQRQLAAAFKRNLLRKTATLDSKRLRSLRVELESHLTDELRNEFGPRGVSVLSISLGELAEE
jgi:regulator of protease activity HflC (stomatin/prohibitin superfamily)